MSPANVTSLVAKQRQAIADSAWGKKFKLVQPRNFTFWVTAFLLFGGVFLTFAEVQTALAAYSTSLAQGTIYFAAFGALLLWWVVRLDRFAKIPGNMKLLIILLGGLVSTFAMAKLYNTAMLDIINKTQGSAFARDWAPGLTAPLSEEIAKLVPLILMIGLAPKIVRSALSGFIIAMLAGLAFQIFEDVLYVYQGAAQSFGDPAAGVPILGIRTVFGFTGHWMWSGIAGAGLVWLIGRPHEPARRMLGASLILGAMLLHATWDSPVGIAGTLFNAPNASFLILGATGIVTVILVIKVYRMAAKREQQWMREILAPEIANKVVTKDEVEAAVGTRKARRRYIKAKKGFKAERRAKHVIEAIMDLTEQIGVDNGVETVKVQRCRAEVARVRA